MAARINILQWQRGHLVIRTNALGHSLRYLYDRASRRAALQNENGAHHQFRYNVLDRVTHEIGFDGRRQRYAYNQSGRGPTG